jgi:hypothetical protein
MKCKMKLIFRHLLIAAFSPARLPPLNKAFLAELHEPLLEAVGRIGLQIAIAIPVESIE